MNTLLRKAAHAPASYVTPTAAHLMYASLDQLLSEFGVGVNEMDCEPGFTGGAYVRGGHSVFFVKPANRPVAEWELTARAMLGTVLQVPMPDLPEPYQLTEL
jgi:hypothetical protein